MSTPWVLTGNDTFCDGLPCPQDMRCWRPKPYDLPQVCFPDFINLNSDLRSLRPKISLEEWEKWTVLGCLSLIAACLLLLTLISCGRVLSKCCCKKAPKKLPSMRSLPLIDTYGHMQPEERPMSTFM